MNPAQPRVTTTPRRCLLEALNPKWLADACPRSSVPVPVVHVYATEASTVICIVPR